jgi:polysaccharide export outer membrane protein
VTLLGSNTLNEAMGVADGVSTASGDPRQIYVIRNTGDAHPLVSHLDAVSPVSLTLAAAFELQPRDGVYVDATPLTRCNRAVNLILPSAQLVVDRKYLSVIK